MAFLFGGLLLLSVFALMVTLLSVVGWSAHRRHEREAFYTHQLHTKLTQMNGVTPEQVREFLREGEAHRRARRNESIKVTGVVSLAIGIVLLLTPWVLGGLRLFFLHMPVFQELRGMVWWSPLQQALLPGIGALGWMFGLVCLAVGGGLLVYAYLLAAKNRNWK